jgi:hypothetical protein
MPPTDKQFKCPLYQETVVNLFDGCQKKVRSGFPDFVQIFYFSLYPTGETDVLTKTVPPVIRKHQFPGWGCKLLQMK